jgi:hypothetical protein
MVDCEVGPLGGVELEGENFFMLQDGGKIRAGMRAQVPPICKYSLVLAPGRPETATCQ